MTLHTIGLWAPRLFFTLLGAAALYMAIWFSGAFLIAQRVEALWTDAPARGIILPDNLPRLSGFPGPYRLFWQGKADIPPAHIDTPALGLSGWPLPGSVLALHLPFGGTLTLPDNLSRAIPQKTFVFTRLHIEMKTPPYFPEGEWTQDIAEDLSRHKLRLEFPYLGGEVLLLSKNTPVAFSGTAWVELDPQLQPRGLMTLDISRPEIVRNILISLVQAPVARSLVNGLIGSLSRPDPVTGEIVLPLTLRVENRRFYVGMFQIATLPEIIWPDPGAMTGPLPKDMRTRQ